MIAEGWGCVMQDDLKREYSDAIKIQNLIKNYSQFISFPIHTWKEKTRTTEVFYEPFKILNSLLSNEFVKIGKVIAGRYCHASFDHAAVLRLLVRLHNLVQG